MQRILIFQQTYIQVWKSVLYIDYTPKPFYQAILFQYTWNASLMERGQSIEEIEVSNFCV